MINLTQKIVTTTKKTKLNVPSHNPKPDPPFIVKVVDRCQLYKLSNFEYREKLLSKVSIHTRSAPSLKHIISRHTPFGEHNLMVYSVFFAP